MRQVGLEITHSKVRNLSKIDIASLSVFSLISLKYDVTDAILQDNKTIEVQYLGSLLFEILQDYAKDFRLISKFVALAIKTRLLFSHNKKSVSPIFL